MSAQLTPICVRGRYLWTGESRFFVRGVAYQIRNTMDPISDDCLPRLEHDVVLFKELGLNTLFVYSIDNTKAHTKAMKLLEEAGIYVLTTISSRSCAINRSKPYESYNSNTIMSFFKTVDVMASYSNTLGLVAANELINNDETISVAPVIKSVVRDLKEYMKLKNEFSQQRILPICYNASRCGARDKTILDYLSSGDTSSSIDFWTVNDPNCKNYSWAGDSSMAQSGYNDLLVQLRDVALPIFFSEYGNNTHQPRVFQETKALYSPQMSKVFSGGCVYEFWQEMNGYGLVELIRKEKDTGSVAHQKALVRADDQSKVFQKRDTDQGLLLIYHDFANYQANLAAARRGRGSDPDQNRVNREETERSADITQSKWPWEPEFHEPESCVDWEQIAEIVRSNTV